LVSILGDEASQKPKYGVEKREKREGRTSGKGSAHRPRLDELERRPHHVEPGREKPGTSQTGSASGANGQNGGGLLVRGEREEGGHEKKKKCTKKRRGRRRPSDHPDCRDPLTKRTKKCLAVKRKEAERGKNVYIAGEANIRTKGASTEREGCNSICLRIE